MGLQPAFVVGLVVSSAAFEPNAAEVLCEPINPLVRACRRACSLSLVFRGVRWLRLVSVVILLGAAALVWTAVVAAARLAVEKAHLIGEGPGNPFVAGTMATRDIALGFGPLFWTTVLGLVILAIVPHPKRQ